MNTVSLTLTLNGAATGPHEVPEGLSMNDFLREYVGLTGTKFGCGIGACSACAVIVDRPDGTAETVRSCITGADFFAGKSVRTVEGIAAGGALTAVQVAYLDHFAFQCGYCTPGFVNGGQVLVESLAREPVKKADVEARVLAALDGHICRCTGYVGYYTALRDAILADPRLTV
jgi:xanthine dehydrogenase YagT iron-sulfur-binding subunit